MSIKEAMSAYAAARREFEISRGFNPSIKIDNLEGRCTDDMREEHLASDDIIVVSHPGWHRLISDVWHAGLSKEQEREIIKEITGSSRLTQRRQVEVQRVFWARTGQFQPIYDELVLEELVVSAEKAGVPVVFTISSKDVPSQYAHSARGGKELGRIAEEKGCAGVLDALSHDDKFRRKIIADDNMSGNYLAFIKSLMRQNIYLLPTMPDSGLVFSDKGLDVLELAYKAVQNGFRLKIVDGKHVYSHSPSEPDLFPEITIDFNLASLAFGHLSPHGYNRLEAVYGQEFLSDAVSVFWEQVERQLMNQISRMSQDAIVTPLLKDVLFGDWDSVYLGGGNFEECLRATASYFMWAQNPRLVVVEEGTVYSGHSMKIHPPLSSQLVKEAEGLVDPKTESEAKQNLLHHFRRHATLPDTFGADLESLRKKIEVYSEHIHSHSNPVVTRIPRYHP